MEWLLANPVVDDIVTLFRPALFNIYFALVSIPLGFPLAVMLALARFSRHVLIAMPARVFIYAFRGSPLFIQFFMFYSLMLSFNRSLWKPLGVDDFVLHPLFLGPLVLILNTSAYTAEIFYGALKSVPRGEIEAAKAMGMNRVQRFRCVEWPHTLRLAWPAYTNEVVFLFHATALVYLTLPVINEQKDLMNKAGELFERDYNVVLHFSVAALYFLLISVVIFFLFNRYYRRLNAHISGEKSGLRWQPNYMR